MKLDKTIEGFYLSILDYAGLTSDKGSIIEKGSNPSDFLVDGKPMKLPYFELLKNEPDSLFFHPLNEDYSNPEDIQFTKYKQRLLLELNGKLVGLLGALINIAVEPSLQDNISSPRAISIISSLGDVDMKTLEALMSICSDSIKEHGVSYLFDIYIKKNGKVGNEAYSSIGKINFRLYKEIRKGLDDPNKEYKVSGRKLRKKDLVALTALFENIFPNINEEGEWTVGSNNKIFRFLHVLLTSSYMVSNVILELKEDLKGVNLEDLTNGNLDINLDWTDMIQDLLGMSAIIRAIPNQRDAKRESVVNKVKKLNYDESQARVETPSFDPSQLSQEARSGFSNRVPAPVPPQPQPQYQGYPQSPQPQANYPYPQSNQYQPNYPYPQPPQAPQVPQDTGTGSAALNAIRGSLARDPFVPTQGMGYQPNLPQGYPNQYPQAGYQGPNPGYPGYPSYPGYQPGMYM